MRKGHKRHYRERSGPPPQGSPFGEATTSGKAIASLICGLFIFFFPLSAVPVIWISIFFPKFARAQGASPDEAWP